MAKRKASPPPNFGETTGGPDLAERLNKLGIHPSQIVTTSDITLAIGERLTDRIA